jgi:hypothetical protein
MDAFQGAAAEILALSPQETVASTLDKTTDVEPVVPVRKP